MLLLETKKLTYETNGKRIIENLDLYINTHEVLALLGANGSGKSTIAYLVVGCDGYKPTSGEILFEGVVINKLKIHERAKLGITMAWQEPVRFEGISVWDYLNLKNKEMDPSESLEIVGLEPELYLGRMVDKSLSGGERKRIELASILTLDPKLAILDEPDSGIDMLSIQDIINVINIFRQSGSSVLLITHREDIASMADRASLICGGKIVVSGNPEKVTEYYKSRRCQICDGDTCIYV